MLQIYLLIRLQQACVTGKDYNSLKKQTNIGSCWFVLCKKKRKIPKTNPKQIRKSLKNKTIFMTLPLKICFSKNTKVSLPSHSRILSLAQSIFL